jgi:hypothetical protein
MTFSPAVQTKLDRVRLRTENRARLSRIREALRRIEDELAAAVEHHRKSFTSADLAEEGWLKRIRVVRAEIRALEI